MANVLYNFIGSEGTLGIITKVLLKLVPKPAAKETLLATFSQMEAAAETVSAIITAKIIPCTLEFLDMVRFIQQTAARHSVRVGTFGHMGDGNLHPTFLTDEKNTAEMERVEKAMAEIFDYAVALGGTITGEHGVGLAKKAFLPKAIGDASLETMLKNYEHLQLQAGARIWDPNLTIAHPISLLAEAYKKRSKS